ncbi:hypothetical protein AAVH_09473 [Aphelenchoides avenae]|nr:hypothetical protein AAVH_09473 [Aphelenchus avenae]
MEPVDGGRFAVTDDAIVEFCVQPDVQTDQEGDASKQKYGELKVYKGKFTKTSSSVWLRQALCRRARRTLRIVVSPVRFEEEDLRDFAQHLSYRQRGWPGQERIYDFPGEQHDADAAMDLQIALFPGDRLEVVRARRPNPLFRESDE